MLKKNKGSILVEGIVGVFIISIAGLVIISILKTNIKVKEITKRFETAKEIERLIIKEIKYNLNYCDAVKLFREDKKYPIDINYYNAKIKENGFLLMGESTISGEDYFVVKLKENKKEWLVFDITSQTTGEVEFYKYPFR